MQKRNTTNLAKHLVAMLDKRKPDLFQNPAIISALALDPRFCNELDDDQKNTAVENLTNLWKRLVPQDTPSIESITLNDSEESSDEDITMANTTILSNFMKRKEGRVCADSRPFDIRGAITSFMEEKHEISDGTILDFWIQKKNKCPELYMLAEVILAISPTQAVVERSFSTLSYIFNTLRNRLSDKMIDDILIISLNKDLFYAVNEQELNSLINTIRKKNTLK